MSRSGYSEGDDYDEDSVRRANLYRGTVERAIRGKRGQKMLRELREALEAMPEKRLVDRALVRTDGDVCALGALARHRGIKIDLPDQVIDEDEWDDEIDDEDVPWLAETFDVAHQVIREIIYENDECPADTPEGRWQWVHRWVCCRIRGGV